MKIILTAISDLLILKPTISDQNGFFFESFSCSQFTKLTRLDVDFIQYKHSYSIKNVLQRMHYQILGEPALSEAECFA